MKRFVALLACALLALTFLPGASPASAKIVSEDHYCGINGKVTQCAFVVRTDNPGTGMILEVRYGRLSNGNRQVHSYCADRRRDSERLYPYVARFYNADGSKWKQQDAWKYIDVAATNGARKCIRTGPWTYRSDTARKNQFQFSTDGYRDTIPASWLFRNARRV